MFFQALSLLFRAFLIPTRAVPEFRMVVAADHGDALGQAGKVAQVLRQEDTSLPVEIAAGRIREQRAHLALLQTVPGAANPSGTRDRYVPYERRKD